MRTFAFTALVGTTFAAPATVFHPGDAPKCYVMPNGSTRVEYTSANIHPSFKCTHTGNTCSCTNPHPTHHTGSCKQFDHTDGTTHPIDGDCTASGLNAIDGGWSTWSAGSCSKSCGSGVKAFTRTCTNPAPFNGGAQCSGSASKSESCNTQPCPVDGGWSSFSSWSACTKTCGGGSQSRTRSCQGKAFGGKDCSGSASESRACNSGPCPIHGTWSAFSSWSSCSATCGGGTKTRTRTCNGRAHGGNDCVGSAYDSQSCNSQSCGPAGQDATIHLSRDYQYVNSSPVGAGQTLWLNRNYAFTTMPNNVKTRTPFYQRVNLNGGPCPREGGGKFTTNKKTEVSICCANHCGVNNPPTGMNNVVRQSGSYAITQHGGSPCTFYTGTVEAGSHHICCGNCWASGLFLPVKPTSTKPSIAVSNSWSHTTVPAPFAGKTLWLNRNYAFTSMPSDVQTKTPFYSRVNLNGGPCPREGGGKFTTNRATTVSICCANHCGVNNRPTGMNNVVQKSGSYAITQHGGSPCTFYQGTVGAGTHHICCGNCWASGLFYETSPN